MRRLRDRCVVSTALALTLVGCRMTSDGGAGLAEPGGTERVIDRCDDTPLAGIRPATGIDRRRDPRGAEAMGTIGGRALPGLFRFDLSSLPRDARIRSARLRLHVASWDIDTRRMRDDRPITASIAPLIETWDEASATWYDSSRNQPWQSIGGTIRPNSHVIVPTVIEKLDSRGRIVQVSWDVTATVRQWTTGSRQNHGLIIWLNGNVGPMLVTMSEAGEAANRPALVMRHD